MDLATPSMVKLLKERHHFHFRKSLGQNFLVDANIVNKIISSAKLDQEDIVIEIGPGMGVITRAAASIAQDVVAFELDKSLMPVLEDTLQGLNNVHIVYQDAMKADFNEAVLACTGHKGPYKLIANLPYYITTPLIMHVLENGFDISLFIIMVQHEVAERMAALPGGKEYGALSVAVQYYTEVSYLFRVPGTVFVPRPEVDSAVVQLVRRKKPAVEVPDEKLFFKVVRGSFGQRRKTLLNSLGTAFAHIPKDEIKRLLVEASIDPSRRGETLSLEEFASITVKLHHFRQ